jgi:hypothetical protein
LKLRGHDLDRVVRRVAPNLRDGPDEVFSKGKHQKRVGVRSPLCFWGVCELDMPLTELAKKLGISVPG